MIVITWTPLPKNVLPALMDAKPATVQDAKLALLGTSSIAEAVLSAPGILR